MTLVSATIFHAFPFQSRLERGLDWSDGFHLNFKCFLKQMKRITNYMVKPQPQKENPRMLPESRTLTGA